MISATLSGWPCREVPLAAAASGDGERHSKTLSALLTCLSYEEPFRAPERSASLVSAEKRRHSRSERSLVWDQDVGGSNPLAPTIFELTQSVTPLLSRWGFSFSGLRGSSSVGRERSALEAKIINFAISPLADSVFPIYLPNYPLQLNENFPTQQHSLNLSNTSMSKIRISS